MHVTQKVVYLPCESPDHLPEAQMSVYQNTDDVVARTVPPIDPSAGLHRLEYSQHKHDNSVQTCANVEVLRSYSQH